ncbi:MAG TPA: serine/threonine-protein kinase [Planctomycetota bacterium]|nr:serine/threonine-protein kinase [Planctomycetota bacterium]
MAQLQSDANLDGATEVEGYKVLPPCVIYSKIGQGGMGAVYRGRHLNLDIDVAVKCLKPGLVGDDEQFVVRFRREARSAAAINHQNVIRVYDVAEDHGLHYLIMELVQGETARERVVRKQRLQVGEALEIVHGSALGLAEAHRKGFIHRDIKPDNIMISSAGQVKLADLGLAKAMTRDDHASMLSGANLVMGTPQYMPPEQWEDTTSVTAAADIWALGATLYYLLVGVEAIPKDSLPRIMQRIVHKPFPDVRAERADVPDEVAELIAKATRTAVADRFQNGQELAAAIEALQSRRVGLRDKDAAPSTQLQTLLSPPPPKTLAKIKFWLDEQNQKPANERSPSARPNGAAASSRAEAGAPSFNMQSTVPGSQALPRPRRLVPLLGALAIVAAALVLWFRPWLPVDNGPFALAAQLEDSGRFEEAIAETRRVHETDPNLAGKETRLARLHAAWAGQCASSSRFREALQQLDASLGFARDPTVQRQQRELLARIAGLLDNGLDGLERTWPSGKQVPRAAKIEFRGRLASPLVAALKLGGSVVARKADGTFRAELALEGRREVAVAVTLVGGEQLDLPAWTFDYAAASADRSSVPQQVDPEVVALEFVTPPEVVGARSLGDDRYAVAQATVQLRGQLKERAESVLVNETPVTDLQWRDGVFVCTVPLQEGRNDLRLQAQKKLRRAALRQMTVFRLGAPRLELVAPCKADDVTGAASYEIAVSTDEWTPSVTARCGSSTVMLAKDQEATGIFRGQIALEPGPNQITLEAANVVDAKQTLALRVERSTAAVRPSIMSVKVVVGAREMPIAQRKAGYVRRSGSLRITTSDPAAAIFINNEQVEVAGDGSIAVARYASKAKDEVELVIAAKNASGTSEAFKCRLYFDDTSPKIVVQTPSKPVEPGKSFVCSGIWNDLRGLGSLTVGDKQAVVGPAGGETRSGTWKVNLDAPVASVDLPLVAEDRAGNRFEQKVRIEVAGAAPQGLPAGFVAGPGAAANELGFPRVLVHEPTGIELKALGFAPGAKPALYAATSEVTRLQFAGEGAAEPCGDLTADAVTAWLRDGRGTGLALPTKAEWETLLAAPADLGFQGLRSGKSEWLQGRPDEASWPLVTAAGEPGTLPRDQSRPDLGFRVVLRLP